MKILFPVDGSEACKATLDWAIRFLDPKLSEIYLLHVITLAPTVPLVDLDVDQAVSILESPRQKFENQGFTVVQSDYIVDNSTHAICEFADKTEVDQIIMGSHGYQGVAKFLMGSVSEAVFRNAKQPVLVYRNTSTPSLSISHVETAHVSEG